MRRELGVRRWVHLWFVALLAVFVGVGTTNVSAATFNYDVPAIALVGAHDTGSAEIGSAPLFLALEGSASPSAADRGTSTTSSRSFVATNRVDDHIVLGIREGLKDTASSVGGRTLLSGSPGLPMGSSVYYVSAG